MIKKTITTFLLLFVCFSVYSADRYWVGGGSSTSWGATGDTNWSTSSGGSGNASVPTSSDDVYFDANSGSGTAVIDATADCLNADFTGFEGTLEHDTGINWNVYGSLTFDSGMTYSSEWPWAYLNFAATSGSHTVTWDGVSGTSNLNFGSSGSSSATWTCTDYLAISRTVTLTSGTLTTADVGAQYHFFNSSNTNTRTWNMGDGTIQISYNQSTPFNCSTSTNLTINGESSTLLLKNGTPVAGLVYAAMGSNTYNNVSVDSYYAAGRGYALHGSFTCNVLTAVAAPDRIAFEAGKTITVNSFVATGSSGNEFIINSSTSAAHTLSDSSGTNEVSWCNISYSEAEGGATWDATDNCTDSGNNSGWDFVGAPPATPNYLMNIYGQGILRGIGGGLR
ncbi:MAG: hypothetical protein M0P69_04395 [Bacteroidales bacterium]|nr:hypothetical protein [Bacteroidales bacterium]